MNYLCLGDTDDEFGQNIFTLVNSKRLRVSISYRLFRVILHRLLSRCVSMQGGLTQSESVLVNAQDEENGYESGLLRQSCTYNRDCLSQGGIDDVSTAWERYIQPAPLKATSGDAYVRISNSYGFFFTGRSVDDTKTTLYNDGMYSVQVVHYYCLVISLVLTLFSVFVLLVYGVNHLSPDGAWDEKERFELRSAAPYSPR